MIKAVLFDLDGVVRHFDPEQRVEIERRHGLDPGQLESALFAEPHLSDVITGRTTKRVWLETVGTQLGRVEAALEWGRSPARPDAHVLALAVGLRELGLQTAILTNGTDETPADVALLELETLFDPIVSTAEIGHAKPDRRAFEHVVDRLGLAPGEVFFTDDSAGKLAGADEIGMVTHHFTGIESLRAALAQAGVRL